MNDKAWFYLVAGLLGFFIGGIVGEVGWGEFWNGAVIGLAIVWGVPLCWHSFDCN